MILGLLRSVFYLIVVGHFLSPFALGSAPLTVLSSCSPPPLLGLMVSQHILEMK